MCGCQSFARTDQGRRKPEGTANTETVGAGQSPVGGRCHDTLCAFSRRPGRYQGDPPIAAVIHRDPLVVPARRDSRAASTTLSSPCRIASTGSGNNRTIRPRPAGSGNRCRLSPPGSSATDYRLDTGKTGPFFKPPATVRAVNIVGAANQCLDGPIHHVAHPPANSEFGRQAQDEVTKAHALDPSSHPVALDRSHGKPFREQITPPRARFPAFARCPKWFTAQNPPTRRTTKAMDIQLNQLNMKSRIDSPKK